jgi:hypothetical protein
MGFDLSQTPTVRWSRSVIQQQQQQQQHRSERHAVSERRIADAVSAAVLD